MKVIHDKDNFENMIKDMRNVHETIDSLTSKVENISGKLFKMDILGASGIIEDAIEDLEQKLLYDYKDNFEEFIESLDQGNDVMLETDDEIKHQIQGGVK